MGVEGLESIPDNPVDTPADDEVAEQIYQRENAEARPDGEAERQAQDDQKLRDHKERQERLADGETSVEESAPKDPEATPEG